MLCFNPLCTFDSVLVFYWNTFSASVNGHDYQFKQRIDPILYSLLVSMCVWGACCLEPKFYQLCLKTGFGSDSYHTAEQKSRGSDQIKQSN